MYHQFHQLHTRMVCFMSSAQAATCNSSTQQRHTSAQKIPGFKAWRILKFLGCHHVTYPTNNQRITSLRPRRPNKGRSPATWGLCDPRNAECDEGQAFDQRRVVSFLLGSVLFWMDGKLDEVMLLLFQLFMFVRFAWSLLGQAYLVANPNSDWLWFQVDIVLQSRARPMPTFWTWSTGLQFLSCWPFLQWFDGPYGFRRTRRPPVTLVKVVDVDVGDEELESRCIIFAGSIWQDIQQEFRVAGFRYSMPR